MKNESVVSRIISAIKGNKVAIRENLFYDTVKGNLDFAADDLINKRCALAILAGGGVDPVPITAGTTVTPLIVAYSASANPSYILQRADDSFDWNTDVKYDGANFTIAGDDDGSGKFADSYTFVIKP